MSKSDDSCLSDAFATPTMYELSDFVGKLADKWIFIGIRLGLENEVKALKTSPNNADAKLTILFQKWIDGGHKSIGNQVIEVSWDYLIKQLRTDFISMGGVADEVEGTLNIQNPERHSRKNRRASTSQSRKVSELGEVPEVLSTESDDLIEIQEMISERNKYLSELEIQKQISSLTVLSPETLEEMKLLLSDLEKEQEKEESLMECYRSSETVKKIQEANYYIDKVKSHILMIQDCSNRLKTKVEGSMQGLLSTPFNMKRQHGSFGSGKGVLQFPDHVKPKALWGICVCLKTGSIYVSDPSQDSNQVHIFSATKVYQNSFCTNAENKDLTIPRGMDITNSNELIIACDKEIAIFSLEGVFKDKFGRGILSNPCDVKIHQQTHTAFVADVYNDRIVEFSLQGDFLRELGSRGDKPGELCHPSSIAFSPNSRELYISDCYNKRIQVFSVDPESQDNGTSIRCFGDGSIKSPRGLLVTSEGFVFVVQRTDHCISIFDSNGVNVHTFGHALNDQDNDLKQPFCVAFSQDGMLLVTEYLNKRVQLF